MRIACIVDIHGNLAALDAVLADIDRIGTPGSRVDRIVCCGDIVLGAPDSRACWLRLQERGIPSVRGNTDRYVADADTERAEPAWSSRQWAPAQFAAAEFSDDERAALRALPLTLTLPEAPGVLFSHATPAGDDLYWRPWSTEDDLRELYDGHDEGLFVSGHDHTQRLRPWGDRLLCTCGSVGLPVEGPGARYALLEQSADGWHVQHRHVDYDLDATMRRYDESGWYERTGPIGRLFARHVLTATQQVVPFLVWWRASGRANPDSPELADAVDRWLALV
jgi:predicted phosphodiesterase